MKLKSFIIYMPFLLIFFGCPLVIDKVEVSSSTKITGFGLPTTVMINNGTGGTGNRLCVLDTLKGVYSLDITSAGFFTKDSAVSGDGVIPNTLYAYSGCTSSYFLYPIKEGLSVIGNNAYVLVSQYFTTDYVTDGAYFYYIFKFDVTNPNPLMDSNSQLVSLTRMNDGNTTYSYDTMSYGANFISAVSDGTRAGIFTTASGVNTLRHIRLDATNNTIPTFSHISTSADFSSKFNYTIDNLPYYSTSGSTTGKLIANGVALAGAVLAVPSTEANYMNVYVAAEDAKTMNIYRTDVSGNNIPVYLKNLSGLDTFPYRMKVDSTNNILICSTKNGLYVYSKANFSSTETEAPVLISKIEPKPRDVDNTNYTENTTSIIAACFDEANNKIYMAHYNLDLFPDSKDQRSGVTEITSIDYTNCSGSSFQERVASNNNTIVKNNILNIEGVITSMLVYNGYLVCANQSLKAISIIKLP
jgi:hypothetical protein